MTRKRRHGEGENLSLSNFLILSPFSFSLSLHFFILSSFPFHFLVCSPFLLHFLILSPFSRKLLSSFPQVAPASSEENKFFSLRPTQQCAAASQLSLCILLHINACKSTSPNPPNSKQLMAKLLKLVVTYHVPDATQGLLLKLHLLVAKLKSDLEILPRSTCCHWRLLQTRHDQKYCSLTLTCPSHPHSTMLFDDSAFEPVWSSFVVPTTMTVTTLARSSSSSSIHH